MSRGREIAFAALAGLVFALGLGLSGMTQPSKVIGFLDVTGDWDPSLAFVMVGAIAVHLTAYRLLRGRGRPLLAGRFHLPTRSDIDLSLVLGAAIFGVGWGLGGYCPGPALVSAGALQKPALIFLAAMAAGMVLQHLVARSPQPAPTADRVEERAAAHTKA